MDRKIYQDQYDFELNQRNYLASSVNLPIMATTLVGGALSSMALSFPYKINSPSIIFGITAIFSTIFLMISIYLIFRSFIGYEYQKLQPPSALNNHYDDLLNWHKDNDGTEEDAKNDFHEYLYEKLGEAVEKNSNNNIERGNFLHMATITIAIAMVFLALSGGLYVFAKLQNEPEPCKVQIIGTVKMK